MFSARRGPHPENRHRVAQRLGKVVGMGTHCGEGHRLGGGVHRWRTDSIRLRSLGRDLPTKREREEGEERPNQ
jgi:hypothetical protein